MRLINLQKYDQGRYVDFYLPFNAHYVPELYDTPEPNWLERIILWIIAPSRQRR